MYVGTCNRSLLTQMVHGDIVVILGKKKEEEGEEKEEEYVWSYSFFTETFSVGRIVLFVVLPERPLFKRKAKKRSAPRTTIDRIIIDKAAPFCFKLRKRAVD